MFKRLMNAMAGTVSLMEIRPSSAYVLVIKDRTVFDSRDEISMLLECSRGIEFVPERVFVPPSDDGLPLGIPRERGGKLKIRETYKGLQPRQVHVRRIH